MRRLGQFSTHSVRAQSTVVAPVLPFLNVLYEQTGFHPLLSITRRQAQELRSMCQGLHLDPANPQHCAFAIDMANLNSEKSTLFQIIRQMAWKVSTNGEDHFNENTKTIYEQLEREGWIQYSDEMYTRKSKELQQKAHDLVETLFSKNEVELPQDPILERVQMIAREGDINPDNKEASAKVCQDRLTFMAHNEELSSQVSSRIQSAIDSGKFESLRTVPLVESTVTMLGGPAASGKGFLTKCLLEQGKLDI